MQSSDARILRGAAIPTGLVGAAAISIGLLAAGAAGALAAAFGLVLVVTFFAVSLLAVAYAGRVSPQIMMQVAMATYLVKIAAMFGLIVALRDAAWLEGRIFGLTVLVSTFVWLGFELRAVVKMKMLYVEPGSGIDRGV